MDAIYYHKHEIHAINKEAISATLEKAEGALWIDLDVSQPEDEAALNNLFNFHPLAIEDVMHRKQRPKADDYENHLFIILNAIDTLDEEELFRELDIFVGKNFIVTAHHGKEPYVELARLRLKQFHIPFEHPVTYLLYMLIDTLIDGYLPILEEIEIRIDRYSEKVLEQPHKDLLMEISRLKHCLNEIWWVIFPQEDVIRFLHQHDEYFYDEKSRYYLRDVSDHLARIANATQSARDTMNGLVNIYMSAVSNRLNFAVNRLTVFTILIGVTTVFGGFYGMNFERTYPSFNDPFGVPIVIGMMILVTLIVLLFMRWQNWIE